MQRLPSSQKESRADCPTDGDHLHLAGCQFPRELVGYDGMVAIDCGGWLRGTLEIVVVPFAPGHVDITSD